MQTPREAAVEIVARMKSLTVPYTFVPAREAEFGHLDLGGYRTFKESLERRGYRFLGDFEILEITNARGSVMQRTMIRSMVSSDGATWAGYYQVKPRIGPLAAKLFTGLLGLRLIDAPRMFFGMLSTKYCVDFESEVAGIFYATSNAEGAASISRPGTIDAQFFPYNTPVEQVRVAHESRLASAIGRTGATPTRVSTMEELRAVQARVKRQKDAHRAASNWITQEELLSFADGNTSVADAVFEEVQKLLAEEPPRP
jgi:hypothetical protein